MTTPLIPQQVFDNALFGIRAQGYRRSTDPANWGKCQYRGSGGTKCGIGFSIPDSVYTSGMDSESDVAIANLARTDALTPLRPLFQGIDIDFLDEVQRAHDIGHADDRSMLYAAHFEIHMEQIAIKWNLTYTPPEVS